jgi:hypothetical protein
VKQDCLLGDLAAAKTARAEAVQRSIHKDHSKLWRQWKEYCESAGLGKDIFLEKLPRENRGHISSAFAVALGEGRFLQPCDAPLASGTVSGTISNMAATFRIHGYPNLSHDEHGNLDWNLSCQYRAYKTSDPKEKQQKAIPFSVLSLII